MPATDVVDTIVPAERIPLTALAAKLGVHAATVLRWVKRGARGVRPHSTNAGGNTVVTPAELAAFLAALNGGCCHASGKPAEGAGRG